MKRCDWCGTEPIYVKYHDTEWGVPVHDDRKLFEFVILDGAQAGLSWITVLKKRENYRKAFNNFDPYKIAKYDQKKIKALLGDSGIIRNRLKIGAAVKNANAFIEVKKEFGSFDKYIWQFVDGETLMNKYSAIGQIPPRSKESDMMSIDMKSRGFSFVGSTICYAFMQAAGLVNDHLTYCFRYKELK